MNPRSHAIPATHVAAPLVVAALMLAGCGSSSSSSPSSKSSSAGASAPAPAGPAQSSAKVEIASFKFGPQTATVKAGAKVTFQNHDTAPHTATSLNPAFDTGTLNKGQSKTITLARPGTYAYHCLFHAFMTGTIVVS